MIRSGEIRLRMEEREKELDELTEALAVAHQQVRWRARKIALEDKVTSLNDQQDRDFELNAGLSDRISQEWDENFGEVDSVSEVPEIKDIRWSMCRL